MEQGRKPWDPSVQTYKEGLNPRSPASGKEDEQLAQLVSPSGSEGFEGFGVGIIHHGCQGGTMSPLSSLPTSIPVRQARHPEFKT